MSPLKRLIYSTIGGKTLVGLTGLALSLFVLTHMAGNMLIFVGPEAYNKYGHALTSNPLIYVAEAGLVAVFLIHVVKAAFLTKKNWSARSQKYAVSASGDKATSQIQKTLWAQGLVILVFVVLHLLTFKYGNYYEVTYGDESIRDLFRLIVEIFNQPIYVIGYSIALIILGLHLSHGVSSAFQTLGLNHPKYTPLIKSFSLFYAVVVAAGFLSQPIYVYFFHKGA